MTERARRPGPSLIPRYATHSIGTATKRRSPFAEAIIIWALRRPSCFNDCTLAATASGERMNSCATSTITSPAFNPFSAASDPGATSATRTPSTLSAMPKVLRRFGAQCRERETKNVLGQRRIRRRLNRLSLSIWNRLGLVAIRLIHILVLIRIRIDDAALRIIRTGVVRSRLIAVFESAERHLDGLLLAVAQHQHVDFLADRAFRHDARQVAHFVDGLAVEFQDDIAGLDRTVVDRSTLDDAGDQRTLGAR
jgi:hypothetical protein